MGRPPPVWPYALAASVLLHALLLGAWMGEATHETESPPRLIEAQLVPAPRPVPPRPSSPPKAAPRPKTAPMPAGAAPTETAPTHVLTEAESDVPDAVADLAAPAAPEPQPASPAEPAAPPLNPLPPRLDLRFDVRYGFARGEQTLVWVNAGDSYTITSVAAATGLVGVFYSGRFAQTSRGRVTPHGLVPEEFWDQRGERRSAARFDAGGTLTYSPPQGAPRHFAYRAGVQDVLSLFFQLALTAPPDGRVEVEVFNGKRLRHYAYEVRGEALLETALGPLRTLHLARTAHADGRFELWLAIDRHYLPVRVLRTDDKGNEMELTVAAIVP